MFKLPPTHHWTPNQTPIYHVPGLELASEVFSSNIKTTETPWQKFEGHTNPISDVVHLLDGQRIITCSIDGSLRVWDLESGEQIGDGWRDVENDVHTIALSPDGKNLASGSEDGAVRLWDVDTGKVTAK